MATLPDSDATYLQETLVELPKTPSPTGFAHRAIDKLSTLLGELADLEVRETRKGGLVAYLLS